MTESREVTGPSFLVVKEDLCICKRVGKPPWCLRMGKENPESNPSKTMMGGGSKSSYTIPEVYFSSPL